MAILIPGPGFTQVGGMWQIFPSPGPSLFEISRASINLNIYEFIQPVTITAQGNLICPGGTPFSPIQPSPELITGVRIDPGTGTPFNGPGVTVLVTRGPGNIPEMNHGVFREPNVNYFGIGPVIPGSPTLALPIALSGYVSEKYLWDGDAGFSELYTGVETPSTKDNLRGTSRTGGIGTITSPAFPRDKKVTVEKSIPGSGTLPISQNEVLPGAAQTVGSKSVQTAAANSSYMWSMKPSQIVTLRFFYVITVTSTCPPYTWYFQAYMDVDNNWIPHGKRIQYRINKQKAALPGEEAKF